MDIFQDFLIIFGAGPFHKCFPVVSVLILNSTFCIFCIGDFVFFVKRDQILWTSGPESTHAVKYYSSWSMHE